MKERPILFSAPMVRAILDGRKTQARRICKGQRELSNVHDFQLDRCPYGKPGNRLWVKETSIITPKHWNDGFMCDHTDKEGDPRMVQYIATHPNTEGADDYKLKKTPSIFMPRWASRIMLEVINVRVERLQDISEEDAIAEGISRVPFRPCDGWPICDGYMVGKDDGVSGLKHKAKVAYQELWESINGPGSWDLNPFVWVVEFKVLDDGK